MILNIILSFALCNNPQDWDDWKTYAKIYHSCGCMSIREMAKYHLCIDKCINECGF